MSKWGRYLGQHRSTSLTELLLPRRRMVFPLIAILLLISMGFFFAGSRQKSVHAASSNPITLENQQPGTTSWQFDNFNKSSKHEIEGYASLTSVNKGSQISFMVSLSANAQYTMDIYRMGYYFHGTNPDGSACTGCGGRLMMSVGPLSGSTQAACPTTTSGVDFGLIECRWTPSYTLTVPTSWTTGNYIVKLTRTDDKLENYMTFVVRDDSSTADIVYSMDVTTWNAYNYWGGAGNNNIGYNLYGKFNDVTQAFVGDTSAYTDSFDRPYMVQGSEDGAGNFMVWDYPMIHWMEAQGYNITYVTDVDLENNANLLNGHKVFTNTGHDEYYSDNMRSNLQHFINAGGNAAFFSADDIDRRMTWSNSISGQPDRREHCDKGALPNSTTINWRDLTPTQPENQIIGAISNGAAAARPFMVYDASSWIYAGTGLVNYNGTTVTKGAGQNAINGLIGYEFSTRAVNDPTLSQYDSYEPAGLQQVGHSFVPAADNGVNSWADTTLYTSSGGGIVFSAGTIEWSWGVDNGFNDGFCDCDPNFANTDSQIITSNILNRMVGGPAPAASLSSTAVSFGNQNLGTTSTTQTVTLTNTGTATLTVTTIALTGANAGDFTQSNNCPISPSTLATSASCTFNVSFSPSANGARSASVSISDSAPGGSQTIALSGTGVTAAPVVTLNPTNVNFGNQNVGTTSAAQTVTLTNTGTISLTVSSITLTGTNASEFTETNNCPASLAVNASCTLSMTFTPSANGARTASVGISDNAAGSPQPLLLSGTGVTPNPAVTLSPTSLNFGNQNVGTTSVTQPVKLTNTGTLAMTITGITLTGTNASDFAETNNCPASLAVNASCTISATFTPSATGARTGNVSINDNGLGSPQSVTLNGAGVTPAPGVGLSVTNLAFGNQSVGVTSSLQTITLTNTGTSTLTIASLSLGGTSPTDFADATNCPISPYMLTQNASCTISVNFTPGAIGPRSASLNINDNAVGSPQIVTLGGTGATPGVTLIGSVTANGNFGAGVAIKLPTVQAGDLLIAVTGANGTPASWTTPTGWTAGAGAGHPDDQGLNWWWKIAATADSGATITLKSASYADGGGIVFDYRGATSAPIAAVSTLSTNDNNTNGNVTSATVNGVSWTGSASVVSLILTSWQPTNATETWPTGYTLQATANDGYGYVAVGANLTSQNVSSLGAQTVKLSAGQSVVPTLQIAIFVGAVQMDVD